MTLQVTTTTVNQMDMILALPVAERIQVNSHDYGFDFDEDELGRELLAQLTINRTVRSFPEVDAVAFEETLHYIHF